MLHERLVEQANQPEADPDRSAGTQGLSVHVASGTGRSDSRHGLTVDRVRLVDGNGLFSFPRIAGRGAALRFRSSFD